ncbi:MAG: DUF362 domain-containing protein [Cyanobacteria bacterium REEB65]|nr:DUF362 domain-containing protein [Cyanobacteria bacterium REEB65]
MPAEVYFAQRRATQGGGLLEKIEHIFDAAGFGNLLREGDRVAVKVQVGERGNATHLRPGLVKRVIKKIRHHRGRPFVTDTGRDGARSDAVGHLILASEHGFDMAATGAPFVVADGLSGQETICLPTAGPHLQAAPLAAALGHADAIVTISHFTAGPTFGYCGALHNLGFLGIAHAERHCLTHRAAALALPESGDLGNTRCAPDPDDCLPAPAVVEAMVEAFSAIAEAKKGKLAFINVLLDITPDPDCHPWSDAPIVPDIGIVASKDPVALDQASADFVNNELGLPGTRLSDPGCTDKLANLHPDVDWASALAYAERLGLGTRQYELLII